MREESPEGVSRRKRHQTTIRGPEGRGAPDLLERAFAADGPDELWAADINYIPTWSGFLYVAVVLDACSRPIVGWSMSTSLKTQLVLDALNMAVWQRRPASVTHHSDHDCKYTSIAFGLRCKEAHVRPSTRTVGGAYDNAMCESYECELLDRRGFKTQI